MVIYSLLIGINAISQYVMQIEKAINLLRSKQASKQAVIGTDE